MVFPRHSGAKKFRHGDSTPEDLAKAKQVSNKILLGLPSSRVIPKARVITSDEREQSVHALMAKERMTAKMWGKRAKRAKDKAEAELAKKATK